MPRKKKEASLNANMYVEISLNANMQINANNVNAICKYVCRNIII